MYCIFMGTPFQLPQFVHCDVNVRVPWSLLILVCHRLISILTIPSDSCNGEKIGKNTLSVWAVSWLLHCGSNMVKPSALEELEGIYCIGQNMSRPPRWCAPGKRTRDPFAPGSSVPGHRRPSPATDGPTGYPGWMIMAPE